MAFANQKGGNGEREVCAMLQPVVNTIRAEYNLDHLKVVRDLSQSREGGLDITCLYPLVIEVKRRETAAPKAWWGQCLKAYEVLRIQGKETIPMLFFRQNRQKWRVITFGNLDFSEEETMRVKVEIELEDALLYVERILREEWRPAVFAQEEIPAPAGWEKIRVGEVTMPGDCFFMGGQWNSIVSGGARVAADGPAHIRYIGE